MWVSAKEPNIPAKKIEAPPEVPVSVMCRMCFALSVDTRSIRLERACVEW